MTIIVFILILSVLVLIHELGHFIAARKSGIVVEEFGIGYPPLAIKLFTWKGTVFSLNWIPFGGFVRMAGEEGPIEGTSKASSGQFYKAKTWQKLLVVLAGPGVNFFFGVVVFAIVFTKLGIPTEISDARIAATAPNSPAAQAGLPVDTSIKRLLLDDGTIVETPTAQTVIDTVAQNQGETVRVVTTGPCVAATCEEIEQVFSVYLRKADEIPAGQGSMGVAFTSVTYTFYPWWQMPFKSVAFGFQQAFLLSSQIVTALGSMLSDLITKRLVPDTVAGPVGIVHQAQTSGLFSQGLLTVLSFSGMLSVNLAVMNVLPIPPLDGGRALLIVVEKVIGRKRTEKLEFYLNNGGYILLMALIIAITIRDVGRIFFG